MKKRMIIVVSIILVIIIFCYAGLSFMKGLTNDKKVISENMEIIKNSYNNIKKEVEIYNDIRDEVTLFINNFYYDRIENEYLDNVNKLNSYDEVINKITNEVKKLDDKCNITYTNTEVNNICNSYKNDYELIVNVFVNDVNSYNRKLSSYNNDNNGNLELFNSEYIKDYIDYNNDSIYEKKEEVNG